MPGHHSLVAVSELPLFEPTTKTSLFPLFPLSLFPSGPRHRAYASVDTRSVFPSSFCPFFFPRPFAGATGYTPPACLAPSYPFTFLFDHLPGVADREVEGQRVRPAPRLFRGISSLPCPSSKHRDEVIPPLSPRVTVPDMEEDDLSALSLALTSPILFFPSSSHAEVLQRLTRCGAFEAPRLPRNMSQEIGFISVSLLLFLVFTARRSVTFFSPPYFQRSIRRDPVFWLIFSLLFLPPSFPLLGLRPWPVSRRALSLISRSRPFSLYLVRE